MERDLGNDSSTRLAGMSRREFMKSVRRADDEAVEAAHVRSVLLLWAERLLPFLNRDPDMTVEEALELYRAGLGRNV
jgi:hypothetical protein